MKRTGARRIADIPANVLDDLNHGRMETANLVEWLALDQTVLLRTTLPALGWGALVDPVLEDIANVERKTTRMMSAISTALLQRVSDRDEREALRSALAAHGADTVRCWAAYLLGYDETLHFMDKFRLMYPLAADPHFGVREIAWITIRHEIIAQLDEALQLMAQWAQDDDENIRRFASEGTRPRGVWCPHIPALKERPERALPVLQPLHSDASRYVRDSVGNWLNDASKTRPEWVIDLCRAWLAQSPSTETRYIVRKALRTLRKDAVLPEDLQG